MFLKQNLFNLCDVFEYIFNNKICSQVSIFFFQIIDALCSNHRRIMSIIHVLRNSIKIFLLCV